MDLNKKGSIRDIALFMVIIFSIGLVSFVLMFTYNTTSNLMLQSPQINDTMAGDVLLEHQETMKGIDYFSLAIFVGFLFAVIITSYLVGGSPVFAVVYVIFFIILGVVSAILEQVWGEVSQMVVFGTTINNLPITDFLLNNLTLLVIVVGFVGLIVMYIRGERLE
jgi:hypothetical protein